MVKNEADQRPQRPLSRQTESDRRDAVSSRLAQICLLAGVTAAVFMAGGPPQGSLGVFLIPLGGAMIVFRPQAKVPWSLFLLGAGVVGWAALAFLPEAWFPTPEWREAMISSDMVPLANRLTPVPRESAFWLALLASSVGGLLFSLAHPVRSKSLVALASLVVLVGLCYAGLSFYSEKSGWVFPYDGELSTFGFFPNKNHTGTFMATGGLVAVGLFCAALRHRRWLPALLAAVGICVFAGGHLLLLQLARRICGPDRGQRALAGGLG